MADDKSTRFWSKVRIGAPEECWEWQGARHRLYGVCSFIVDGKRFHRAHRLAHFLATGEFPPVVMHQCDNPPCCNPAHLRGGTQADNVRDCVLKGRQRWAQGRGVEPFGAYLREREACANGHPYTPENTRWRVQGRWRFRVCVACQRVYNARRYRKENAA